MEFYPKAAILVDGGFYRRRIQNLSGDKTAVDRANELISYCQNHLSDSYEKHELYRIFYYDCPPTNKEIYHPLLKKPIDFGKSDLSKWMTTFLNELKKKRKVALRLGVLSDTQAYYSLYPDVLKKLCAGTLKFDELEEKNFKFHIEQKGVDMKIGIDIASLAYKKQVSKIILVSGDSDFIPAAKLARREGVDFVLDPMWSTIKPELFEHIDGLRSCISKPKQSVGQ